MKYVFVTKSQCPNVQKERAGLAGRQVMGTLQVHAVIRLSVRGIVVNDTTCFYDACFSNYIVEPVCEGWKIHSSQETVREYRRSNKKWIIQTNWQHRVHETQDKQKPQHNMSWTPLCANRHKHNVKKA